MGIAKLVFCATFLAGSLPGAKTLDIYTIDVEGGKAAGLKHIDYLVISHYDSDHLGDVPALVAKFPVRHLVDHGPLTTTGKSSSKRASAVVRLRLIGMRKFIKVRLTGMVAPSVTE